MAANSTVQLPIKEFMGINQAQGEALNMGYATWAENIDTRFNRLATAKGYREYTPAIEDQIITLARFYRRFMPEWERNVLVAATSTAVYVLVEGQDEAWTKVFTGTNDGDGHWDFVSYEDYRDGSLSPVDVLLMSNAVDGMIAIWGDTLETEIIPTPANFSAIARYKERIFGISSEEEDRIWYSAPFNPRDWEQNEALPQDGGGIIDYPTWDGDSFIALRPLGSSLLAFKTQTVCVLTGTSPGEYTIYEAFGTDGPVTENSIVTYQSSAIFLTRNGIGLYDGTSLRTVSRDSLASIIASIDFDSVVGANWVTAAIHDGIYCCAVPINGNSFPNAVIEYDIERGTFMLRTDVYVKAWLKGEGMLLLTTADEPYSAKVWGVGDTYGGRPIVAKWVSPWTDATAKHTLKSGFRIRALIEGEGTVKFSIQTERKTKTKLLPMQNPAPLKQKMLSKAISNKGRQFRWIIESNGVPFFIDTGIQIEFEMDAD